MGPGGYREAPEVQKSLPGGSRELKNHSPEAPGRLWRLKNRSLEVRGVKKSLPEASGGPQKGQKWLKMQHFQWFWGLPWGGPGPPQAVKPYPPGKVTGWFLGPGGRLQRGVLSLRTSEFWRPDLGDLEAKNLDTLEDYRLVAKTPCLNSLVTPKGPADFLKSMIS